MPAKPHATSGAATTSVTARFQGFPHERRPSCPHFGVRLLRSTCRRRARGSAAESDPNPDIGCRFVGEHVQRRRHRKAECYFDGSIPFFFIAFFAGSDARNAISRLPASVFIEPVTIAAENTEMY